jgi:hypothetical protein
LSYLVVDEVTFSGPNSITKAHHQHSFRSDGHRSSNAHEIFPHLNDPLARVHAQRAPCIACHLLPCSYLLVLLATNLLSCCEIWDPTPLLLPSPRVPRPRQRRACGRETGVGTGGQVKPFLFAFEAIQWRVGLSSPIRPLRAQI